MAVTVKGPWLRCGCSVGKTLNDGGSSASICRAVEGKSAEVKRMAHDEFHVNK